MKQICNRDIIQNCKRASQPNPPTTNTLDLNASPNASAPIVNDITSGTTQIQKDKPKTAAGLSPRSLSGKNTRRFTLGKLPNGKPISMNVMEHLTIDTD